MRNSIITYIIWFLSELFYASNILYAQSAQNFIADYNRNIDPLNKLDNIKSIKFRMISKASWNVNSNSKDVQSERNCKYYSNGKSICTYENSLGQVIDEEFDVPADEGGNAVKVFLNIIHVSDNFKFEFLVNNDSVVVIEEVKLSSFTKHQYTFDKKTMTLNQIKRITIRNESVNEAITNYTDFLVIKDIRVPSRAN